MRQPPISPANESIDDLQDQITINGVKYGCWFYSPIDNQFVWLLQGTIKNELLDQWPVYVRPHQSYGWKIKSIKP